MAFLKRKHWHSPKASFQAIVNFIELRDEPTAQWEIKEYAKVLKEQITAIYPKTMQIWSDIYF